MSRIPNPAWGISFWDFLHTVSLHPLHHYTNLKSICDAFEHMEHLIPCSESKSHFRHFKKTHNIRTYVQEDHMLGLFKWTVDLHNSVNRAIGAPTFTVEDALSIWAHPDMMDTT